MANVKTSISKKPAAKAKKSVKAGAAKKGSPAKPAKKASTSQASEGPMSVVRELATSTPAWLPSVPVVKPRKDEPPLVGETLAPLYRVGFPHIRFAEDGEGPEPGQAAAELFTVGWMLPRLLRPRGVWTRVARAYAGSVVTLSSDPRKQSLTKEAKAAIADARPLDAEEVPGLVRALMSEPGSLRNRELTEDFVYALEALCGADCVADAIVDVFESPPPGTALPQMKPLLEDVGLALGFVRLRLAAAQQKALDARLRKVLASGSKRFPIPRLQITAFLETDHAPKGGLMADGAPLVPDVLHTTDKAQILAALKALRVDKYTIGLPDPRLVFLAGSDALPLYLSKFRDYERQLHPNVARARLGAFVDAIAPFDDPQVATWLRSLQTHPLVGADAKAWLAIVAPS